eukprot:6474874-Amphidinium_carterae.5
MARANLGPHDRSSSHDQRHGPHMGTRPERATHAARRSTSVHWRGVPQVFQAVDPKHQLANPLKPESKAFAKLLEPGSKAAPRCSRSSRNVVGKLVDRKFLPWALHV